MGSLDDLAQHQYGLVTRLQAIDLLGRAAFRRAVAQEQLVRVGTGVFRCRGTEATFRQRAMAACLAFGPTVAVSHRSAAALWGYELVFPGPEIEVSLPTSRSGRRAGIRVHRGTLAPADLDRRYGIVVTSPGRTLLDLARTLPGAVLERCVDDALRTRHAVADELMLWLTGEARRGQAGTARLLRLLELRSSSGIGDSAAVDRIYRSISRAGLPAPVIGLTVVVAGRHRVLDLGYPVEKIAIEFNGWEYHQMRSRMDADHARTTELELAGWIVIVVTAAHTEAATVDRVTRALAWRAGEGRSGMLGR
jgi:hypothetical protein